MELYLLRHADADTPAATDEDRWLSEKGEEQAQRVARFCKTHQILPSLVLTSPVRRARETAETVAGHLGVEVLTVPWLACGMNPETALEEISAYRSQSPIMIVGHEPDFSLLVASLLGLPSNSHVHIRKASLTRLDLPTLRAGTARLDFTIPCKLMP
jgi:phosphohistidine phosphatase